MSLLDNERFVIADAADQLRRSGLGIASADRAAAEAQFVARALRLSGGHRLLLLGQSSCIHALTLARAGVITVEAGPVLPRDRTAEQCEGATPAMRASHRCLPFQAGAFDAIAEFGLGPSLGAESDSDAILVLRELQRVLRRHGRYLTGGDKDSRSGSGTRLSSDRSRQEIWRTEAGGIEHRTLRLARRDGTWQSFHQRLRKRSYDHMESLLSSAGFNVLNALRAYRPASQEAQPGPSSILLCERI